MRVCLPVTFLLLLLVAASPVGAEGQKLGPTESVIVPEDGDAARTILAGRNAAKESNWKDACGFWLRILADSSGGMAENLVPADTGRYIPAAVRVAELIAGLPPEGMKVYSEIVDGRAAGAWRLAVRSRDVSALRRIPDRFPWTRASIQASDFLAAAARRESDFSGELRWLKRSILTRKLLDGEIPVDLLGRFRQTAILAMDESCWTWSYRIGNKPLPKKRPKALMSADPQVSMSEWKRITTFKGGYGPRISRSSTSAERMTYAWKGSVLERVLVPGVHIGDIVRPVSDGVNVYVQDGQHLSAYSLEDGREIWCRKAPRSYRVMFGPQVVRSLAVGGGRIFCPMTATDPWKDGDFDRMAGCFTRMPKQDLYCTDAASGRTLWALRDANPELKEYSFPGNPTVDGDTVYSVGVRLAGMFGCTLVAADAETGKLRWKRFLGSGQQEMSYYGRPVREAVPGMPVIRGESVVVSTNVGVVAAVDRKDGGWKWAFLYPRVPASDQQRERDPGRIAKRLSGLMDRAPVFSADSVVVGPVDSQTICALDVDSGKPRWMVILEKVRRARGDCGQLWNIDGAVDGKVLISGRAGAMAMDCFTGKRVFMKSLKGSRFSGVVDGTNWMIPGPGVLTVINLRTGDSKKINWRSINGEPLVGSLALIPGGMAVTQGGMDAGQAALDDYTRRLHQMRRTRVNPVGRRLGWTWIFRVGRD